MTIHGRIEGCNISSFVVEIAGVIISDVSHGFTIIEILRIRESLNAAAPTSFVGVTLTRPTIVGQNGSEASFGIAPSVVIRFAVSITRVACTTVVVHIQVVSDFVSE